MTRRVAATAAAAAFAGVADAAVFEVVVEGVYLLPPPLETRFGFLALTDFHHGSMRFASAEALVDSRP